MESKHLTSVVPSLPKLSDSDPCSDLVEMPRLTAPTPKMWTNYLWRQRIKFEATVGLTVMDPWERTLTMVVFTSCLLLLVSGLYRYLPQQVSFVRRSATYYLWGHVSDDRVSQHVVDSPTLKEI